jgi:hypothetical protein
MKTKINRIACLLALVCAVGTGRAIAQDMDGSLLAENGDSDLFFGDSIVDNTAKISLSAEGGTTGGGGTLALRFADNFGASAGFDEYRHTFKDQKLGDVNIGGSVRLKNESAGLRLFPDKDSSFFLCVGAFFNQNRLDGTANGKFTINGTDYSLPAGESLKLRYEQKPVVPFVTIGGNFFYFDDDHHWALGGELGAVLIGKPRLTMQDYGGSSISAADLQSWEKTVRDDLNKVSAWPIIKVQLTYCF